MRNGVINKIIINTSITEKSGSLRNYHIETLQAENRLNFEFKKVSKVSSCT